MNPLSTLDLVLLEKLRCPHCVAAEGSRAELLQPHNDTWLIARCGRKYPIREGIPILLPEEGERWMEVETERLPAHPDTG